MQLLYFAWVRQSIGTGSEQKKLPENVTNVAGVIDWLRHEGEGYAEAFRDVDQIKFAVNQIFVSLEAPVKDSDEVAFFPPVTGG